VLRKCTGRNLYNDPENTLELSTNTNQSHRKKRSGNGLLLEEVSLQILPTEKLCNLCTRRWFLTASVQAHYDRRRRRRCLNRVAKLEWSSLILVLASRNVWHKRTTQTFCMDFFEFFAITRAVTRVVPKTAGWLSLSPFSKFLEDFMAVAISVIPTHLCWKQLVIDKWNRISLAYSEFIYSWNFLMT
jgi:hypothetical protein